MNNIDIIAMHISKAHSASIDLNMESSYAHLHEVIALRRAIEKVMTELHNIQYIISDNNH